MDSAHYATDTARGQRVMVSRPTLVVPRGAIPTTPCEKTADLVTAAIIGHSTSCGGGQHIQCPNFCRAHSGSNPGRRTPFMGPKYSVRYVAVDQQGTQFKNGAGRWFVSKKEATKRYTLRRRSDHDNMKMPTWCEEFMRLDRSTSSI